MTRCPEKHSMDRLHLSALWIGIAVLAACSPAEAELPPTSTATALVPSPVGTTPTGAATAKSLPTETAPASQTATQLPTSPPTETSTGRANLTLTVLTCLDTFCPPFWLEQETRILLDSPGILDVVTLDEKDILVHYDPALFTEAEVIELFVEATGLEVSQ